MEYSLEKDKRASPFRNFALAGKFVAPFAIGLPVRVSGECDLLLHRIAKHVHEILFLPTRLLNPQKVKIDYHLVDRFNRRETFRFGLLFYEKL
jgi:hypothetical protein